MEPLTLHVATGGDDAAPGTGEAPFATIERAREEVAERLRAGAPRPITVQIHAGTYHLSGTLELDGAVSGTADSPGRVRGGAGRGGRALRRPCR